MERLTRRSVEFVLVFLGLPILEWWQSATLRRWIIPQILLICLVCLVLLWRDRSFDRSGLFKLPYGWSQVLRIAVLFLIGGAALFAWAVWWAGVDPFFLPRKRPGLWLVVLLFYPLLSVLPQEVFFRTFFFHRYKTLFPGSRHMVVASALTFALAHLVLGNWVAPVLAFLGGLLFAWTYSRSQSLLLVTLEHGLWGNWIFTLGLGPYFYGGHF